MKVPYTNLEIGKTEIDKIENLDKNEPKQSNVMTKIVKRQLARVRQGLENWRLSASRAERKDSAPDRTDLIRMYKDIELDPHVSSLMSSIILKCTGSDYWIEKDGEQDEEKTKVINHEWFRKFLRYAIESKFYGHSLIQLGDIKDDMFKDISLVPRENVIPEMRLVKKEVFVTPHMDGRNNKEQFIEYEDDRHKKWMVGIGEDYDLGLLYKATPYVIWKKNAMIGWSEYAELFGMDFRVAKTNVRDPEKLANAEKMMSGMGSAGYAILDNEDEYEHVGATNEDAYMVFENLSIISNKELSKLFVGQTMTSEDGSSRSQAEVHESLGNDYITGYKTFIQDVVNNQLIPIMIEHGVLKDGDKFVYDNSEQLGIKDKFEMVTKLLDFYNIPAEFIENTFKIPIDSEKEVTDLSNVDNKTMASKVLSDVSNMYKNRHDSKCTCDICDA